ncbi:MAG: hypothetical protein LBQ01_01685, partial [Prevotellaceae bacterium]|nr:hypothetical protein [Prevotellaceae bacterium]
ITASCINGERSFFSDKEYREQVKTDFLKRKSMISQARAEAIEHTRHCSVNNFIINLIAALSAYCFFDKKPAIGMDWKRLYGKTLLWELLYGYTRKTIFNL